MPANRRKKMKRYSIRWIAFAIALLLPVGALVAGGASEGSADGERSAPVTVEFFQGKPEAVDTFDVLIEKFEDENPGIIINQVSVPDADQVLTTRLSIDDVPDIFNVYPSQPTFRFFAEEGYVMDLSGNPLIQQVNPGVIELVRYESGIYALPIALNAFGVFYNIDLFEEVGVAVPSSWDEMIATAEVLQSAGVTPFVLTDKDAWTISQQGRVLEGMIVPDHPSYYGALARGEREASRGYHAEVADKMLQLREHSQSRTLATDYGQGIAAFAAGDAAMFINGIWAIPSIESANGDLNYAMFPIPADEPANQTILSSVDLALAVSADSRYQAEALRFIEFLADPENAQIYADLDGSPSAIVGVESSAERYPLLVEVIEAGRIFDWPSKHLPVSVFSGYNGLYQNLIASGKDAFLSEMDTLFADARQ
jgi:raffinose/stachyose/melibiose transport system substrate-binding protein